MKRKYIFILILIYIAYIYLNTYKNEDIFVKDVYILDNTVLVTKINNKLIPKNIYENNVYNIYKNGNYRLYFKSNNYIASKPSYFNAFRYYVDSRIDKIFNYKLKSYAKALLLKDKSYLDDINIEIFKKSGIYHIFATSGFHLGLIYMIVDKLLFFLKKGLKNYLSIFLITCYVLMLGFSPSILRAYYMIVCYRLFKLKIGSEKLLIYLMLFSFLINPYQIFNLSYIFTYLITYMIIVLKKYSLLLRYLILQLVLLPIVVYSLGEYNILSFILNIVYIPLFSILVFLLIIALILNSIFLKNFINEYIAILESSLENITSIKIFNITYSNTFFIILMLCYLIFFGIIYIIWKENKVIDEI